jgi:ParB-like chromosome segregation protein Spo0J
MLTHQPTDTMHLTVTAIAVDQALQVRDGLDDATVARYRESFDRLPPIDVFDTPDGYVLADGFHRYQAAVELGHVEIAARVHRGSRDDAADYAATANAAAGKPLTAAERRRAIIGLHARHPDWTQQRIADAMSVAQSTVHYILASVAVTRATPIKFDNPTTAAVIHQAPPEQWAPLAQAAQEQGWTVQETRAQVRAVTAPPVPLANIAPPPELTDGGADVPTVAYPPVPRGTDATVKRRDVFTLKEWAELHPDMQMTLRDEGIAGSFGPVKFNKQDTDHIEWAQWSWNPVTGCKHDCSYCYARDIAVRFYPHGFAPAFLPYRLAAPRSTQVPPEAATNIAYKNVCLHLLHGRSVRQVGAAGMD